MVAIGIGVFLALCLGFAIWVLDRALHRQLGDTVQGAVAPPPEIPEWKRRLLADLGIENQGAEVVDLTEVVRRRKP